MNSIDEHIVEFFNRPAGKWHAFDQFVVLLDNDVLKGVFVIALFWWVWFIDDRGDETRRRSLVIATLAGAVVAVLVSRLLADLLPFRDRPLHTLGPEFVRPGDDDEFDFRDWSAFPSDHAVLFFALSTGLWAARRRFGLIALLWTIFVICLPRIYLGIHWPSDILAGAVLGVAIGWLATRERVYRPLAKPVLAWHARSPGSFYAAAFVGCYEIARLGNDVLSLLSRILDRPV